MLRDAIGKTDAGFLSQIETRIICDDGEMRWVLIRFKIDRNDNGHMLKLIGVNQDITGRKIAEQQSALVAKLSVQKEAAELANQAKSRFLAAASHDLRQPIHALHLFLGTLNNLDLPPQARRPLANVLRCTESIDEMFVALLDVSKLDAGLIEPQFSDFPVITVLNRIRNECTPQAQAKGLSLHIVPSSAWIRSDPMMVERILRNLVTNAIRYTSSGRIVVGCRRKRDSTLELAVYDTGVGIATEDQDKIFGEFYKAGFSQLGQPGLGLGLSIVDQLAKLLSAPLRLISSEGSGSMFAVTFPQTTNTGIRNLPAPPSSEDFNLAGYTVLVLDDDDAILEATRGLLEQWGCCVITANTIGEAVKLIMEFPKLPDALICDYRLRGKENGATAVSIICEEFNSEIPAMLITGDTSPKRILKLKETGLPVLHKPLKENDFRKALAALIFSRIDPDPADIGLVKNDICTLSDSAEMSPIMTS
jgi:signal transduction histidine kinase/ActR/RegA family two-component response regulator